MKHSRFGASRISTILNCPGFNNAMQHHDLSGNQLDGDEAAADEGNAAHEAVEHSLKLGLNPSDSIGQVFNDHVLTPVMAEHITVYTNHIRSLRTLNPNAKSMIECKVNMSSVAPDVFGTGDHIMIENTTLYIDDLKYGFVVVDEEDNPQCAHYAVSTLDTFKLWFKIKKVVCTIIQPRADHVKGSIRSHEYTIEELMEWRDKFVQGIAAARKSDAPRIAGAHCRNCPVRGTCRARMIRTVFMCSLDSPIESCSNEEIENVLRELPAIKKHLSAVEVWATLLARSGKKFNDFKLVKKRVKAICNNEEELIKLVESKNLGKELLYHPGAMKGKTALMPILKNVGISVDEHFTVPTGQTVLVPLSNSSTAISRSAAGVFKPIKF